MKPSLLLKNRLGYSVLEALLPAVAALALLFSYYRVRHILWGLLGNGDYAVVVLGTITLIAFIFLKVNYGMLPVPFGRLQRFLSVALLVFLLVDPPDLTVAVSQKVAFASQIAFFYWIAIGFALLSLRRPSALLVPAFYLYLVHGASSAITGYSSHRLASVTLLETTQFLSVGVLALVAVTGWNKIQQSRQALQINRNDFAFCFMFVAIGLHLSHYFWSGYQKLRMGEYPWSWVVNNHTENLVLSTLYRGTLPSASYPALTQWLFDNMAAVAPLVNLMSVAIQVLAVVVVVHLSGLKLMSLAYDVMHLGIYLLTGLLLWPWVAINLAILYALKSVKNSQITAACRWCCVVSIVLGGFGDYGNASRLAWWDLRDITGTVMQAQTVDGRWHDLPISYFNSHAQIVSTLMGQVQLQGHYSTASWGASRLYNKQRMSGNCPAPQQATTDESNEDRDRRVRLAKQFIKAHHQKLLARERRFGAAHPYPGLRYLRSPAYLPPGVKQVADIQAYRLSMQSVCLDLVDGQLHTRLIAEDSVVLGAVP